MFTIICQLIQTLEFIFLVILFCVKTVQFMRLTRILKSTLIPQKKKLLFKRVTKVYCVNINVYLLEKMNIEIPIVFHNSNKYSLISSKL